MVYDPGETASTDERGALAAGGNSYPNEPDPDPRIVAEAAGRRVMAEGGREGDALAAHFDVLFRAAAQRDPRVRFGEDDPLPQWDFHEARRESAVVPILL